MMQLAKLKQLTKFQHFLKTSVFSTLEATLITAIITQIFNPTAEIVVLTGIPMTETKVQIETQPVKVEAKIIMFNIIQSFTDFFQVVTY